jgi:hypothetical protein
MEGKMERNPENREKSLKKHLEIPIENIIEKK